MCSYCTTFSFSRFSAHCPLSPFSLLRSYFPLQNVNPNATVISREEATDSRSATKSVKTIWTSAWTGYAFVSHRVMRCHAMSCGSIRGICGLTKFCEIGRWMPRGSRWVQAKMREETPQKRKASQRRKEGASQEEGLWRRLRARGWLWAKRKEAKQTKEGLCWRFLFPSSRLSFF